MTQSPHPAPFRGSLPTPQMHFIGGPKDGQTLSLPSSPPPPAYEFLFAHRAPGFQSIGWVSGRYVYRRRATVYARGDRERSRVVEYLYAYESTNIDPPLPPFEYCPFSQP